MKRTKIDQMSPLGRGSVGRAVAYKTRNPWFESVRRQILFHFNCIEKTKIMKKESGIWYCGYTKKTLLKK